MFSFTPYLNSKRNRMGLYNILIRIYNGERRSASTDYYIEKRHWDPKPGPDAAGVLQYVKKSYYDYRNANKQIALSISHARSYINEAKEKQSYPPTIDEVKLIIEGIAIDEGLDNFVAWARRQVDIEYKKEQVSTINTYLKCLDALEKFISDRRAGDDFSIYQLSANKVRLFQKYLSGLYAPSTVNAYMDALSRLTSWARSDEHLTYTLDPFKRIKKIKEPDREDRKNKDEDVIQVAQAHLTNPKQVMARDFLLTCFFLSGARARDILLLKIKNIDFRVMRVKWTATKTDKKVNTEIHNLCLPFLQKYSNHKKPGDFLFPYLDRHPVEDLTEVELDSALRGEISNIDYHLKGIAKIAGLKRPLSTHSSRYMLSDIVHRFRGNEGVSLVLYHSNYSVSKRYYSQDQGVLDEIRRQAYGYVEELLAHYLQTVST